jgi:hypothetical protein
VVVAQAAVAQAWQAAVEPVLEQLARAVMVGRALVASHPAVATLIRQAL